MVSTEQDVDRSMAMANNHYENFPVASAILPKHLREPIALIYQFARQADDFADEGDLTIEARLSLLNAFQDDLDLYLAYIKPKNPFFTTLGDMIKSHQLPTKPFYDLLSAFKQDVTQTRYQQFDAVQDYCARSANPIGRLLLHLYHAANDQNIAYADNICTALQLINFLQDIAIDFEKNGDKQRIYLCQDEMAAFGITETIIASYMHGEHPIDPTWTQFMGVNCSRARAMLFAGSALGHTLKGRIGFEMRMIILGGKRIIGKIEAVNGDVFTQRPVLNKLDWVVIFLRALFKV